MLEKQTDDQGPATASQRDIITERQWVELSRLLAQRARGGFSSAELATVNGFINYVAPDVETVQQQAPEQVDDKAS